MTKIDPNIIIPRLARQLKPIRQLLDTEDILQRAINIQQIPAPTFEEQHRTAYMKTQFNALGLQNVISDSVDNVYGWLMHDTYYQEQEKSVIIVAAHLDTVFPMETDLTVRRDNHRVFGPGLGDNSLGVSSLLHLAEIFSQHLNLVSENVAICFVANTREEGLGNLDGVRAVLKTISAQKIGAAIILEGLALGRVYHAGIAVRRLRIHVKAEGGHSWLHFGHPSAIHSIAQIIADMTQINVPTDPRTTYNVGVIEGGHSVNSIATDAHCYVDLRSEDLRTLEKLEKQILDICEKYRTDTLQIDIEVVGDRPSGFISPDHPLVQLALQSLVEIGLSGILERGSTDANVFLAANVPTVVTGITYGGNAHRLDEFVDISLLENGMWQLVLLLAATIENVKAQLPILQP